MIENGVSMIDDETLVFPFSAVAGQAELKRALLLCAVDPRIGGVLALGDRGTAKSTTVRALGQLLALIDPDSAVITLPLGASEDRVIGSIDLETALTTGERRFAPGLLAAAHRGFLYVDEVNLLDDYLVDVLLDVAASGVNVVEREGISHRHPCEFVLVGSGNPEEGELRPQLTDRFGLATTVITETDPAVRREIIRRRLDFADDRAGFCRRWSTAELELAAEVAGARRRLESIELPDRVLEMIIALCVAAGAVGHRGEVVLSYAARAGAALRGARMVESRDVIDAAALALRHRVHREAFDSADSVDRRLRDLIDSVITPAAVPA